MKITKRQLRRIIKEEKLNLLREANKDGTISANEDSETMILMADIEEQLEELIVFAQMEADRIGGGFRGPGIRAKAMKLMADLIHDYR
jgi:hypothetical protein